MAAFSDENSYSSSDSGEFSAEAKSNDKKEKNNTNNSNIKSNNECDSKRKSEKSYIDAEEITIEAYKKYSQRCIDNWGKGGLLLKPSGIQQLIIKNYCNNTDNNRNANINILDIGCGLGYDCLAFSNESKCNVNVFGIDKTPQFLNYCQNVVLPQAKQPLKV